MWMNQQSCNVTDATKTYKTKIGGKTINETEIQTMLFLLWTEKIAMLM